MLKRDIVISHWTNSPFRPEEVMVCLEFTDAENETRVSTGLMNKSELKEFVRRIEDEVSAFMDRSGEVLEIVG